MTLESAFGFSLKIEIKPGASLGRARLDGESLAKALSHWRSLPASNRPSLRSISRAPGEGKDSLLNLVLDLGGRDPWICLELPELGRPFPDFSTIWPYCRWWQEELTTFCGLKFEGQEKTAGVSWRLA